MNVYYESTYEKAFMGLLRDAGWTPTFAASSSRWKTTKGTNQNKK